MMIILTKEKQFKIYKEVAEQLPEGYVTIRTIDIGGDKNSPYFDIAAEDNPFLGYRGNQALSWGSGNIQGPAESHT